ncbi:MAG: ATP-grasp domain-containing protein [Longimicrobiales bacterium]
MAVVPTILCLTSFEKGQDLMRECKALGARVLLLTVESLRDAAWPRDILAEVYLMPSLYEREPVLRAVSYLARAERIDRIIALDELNVDMAAALREHLQVPGLEESTANHFRDKLAMRVQARGQGVLMPRFTALFPYNEVRRFLSDVPSPWVLKPRTEASAVGIRMLRHADELWRVLEELGDRQSHHLLEEFIAGEVYHADAIVVNERVVICEAHRYFRPPFDVYHGGGLFRTSTLPRHDVETYQLQLITQQIASALGLDHGIMHAEFIRGADGRFYFLETAARVGGAYINELVEAATGLNLWREWARLEVGVARGEAYSLPPLREEYGGVIMSLARQEWPDTSAYADAEIVYRIVKSHHAGFVLASTRHQRISELLDDYSQRFMRDFHATLPPQQSLR